MKFTIALFLTFSVPPVVNATDVSQCQFSFYAVDVNGDMDSKPYLTSDNILLTEKRFSKQQQEEVIYI